MNHYVYFITNEDKMKYIGVRSSECSPAEDTKYWGSSKHTPKDICDTGVKEIVEVFATREEAVALEIELHNKWNVAVNPWFYNQAKQTSTGFDTQGSTEVAAKISKARTGLKFTKEHKAKMSAAKIGDKHPTADVKKYWFMHKLYGLVWCTRYYLRTHFNKPDRLSRLFHKKPRKSCAGWSLYKGDER